MDCHDVRAQLDELAEGRLAPEEQAQIEAHLAGCTRCRARAAAARRMVALLQTLQPEIPPASLSARIILMIQARAAAQARSRRRWLIFTQAATAVGLALLALSAADLIPLAARVDLAGAADSVLAWLGQVISEPVTALSALTNAGLTMQSGIAETMGLVLTLAVVVLAVASFGWLGQTLGRIS